MGTAGSGSVLGGCGWPLGCWTRGRAAGDPIISRVLTEEKCHGNFEDPWTLPVELSSGLREISQFRQRLIVHLNTLKLTTSI